MDTESDKHYKEVKKLIRKSMAAEIKIKMLEFEEKEFPTKITREVVGKILEELTEDNKN